ncbi:MAG: DUF58 domain-containing protein [Nitrospinota bacterium]|nr:DUF58 domain-containing protein [Nitrospinota bacterium]
MNPYGAPPPPDEATQREENRTLPEKIREIEIRARKVVNSLFSGEYHSVFKGMGLMYAESRPYQPGDDVRAMDWKVTARTGQPFIKVFHEERELTLMLMVDMSGSGHFGSQRKFKSETAAELCAALAFSAIRNNDKVGLIAFTHQVELFIAPRKGRSHALRLIREILYFKPEGKGTNIRAALEFMSRVISKKSIAFLVSDLRDEGYDKAMAAMGKKHDLIAVRVFDKREESLPDVGYLAVEDAETGERMVIDTSDPALRESFAQATARTNKRKSKDLAAAGVDEVAVDAGGSYVEPLVKFFKLRERRRRFG